MPTKAETAIEAISKTFDKVAGYIRQAVDLIGQAVTNSTTRQKNDLQKIEDQQEQNYANQKQRIEDSTLNEQDKAAKLIQLDADRTVQKEANARKEREIAREQAVFEKAAALTNITLQTIQATIAALRPPPVGLGPVAGIPLAIATAAIGAAQFAIAAAAPIPAFEHGTYNAPEGVAKVSEKGRELVVEPSGSTWYTPQRESYVYLRGGSRVIPAHEVERMIWNGTVSAPAPYYGQQSTTVDMSTSERYLRKIAGKKWTPHIHVHVGDSGYGKWVKS